MKKKFFVNKMKSVTFNPRVTVFVVPVESNPKKMTIPERDISSFEDIADEIKRRRQEAVRIAKENIEVLKNNAKILREVLNPMEKTNEDYEYFKTKLEEMLFDLKQWHLKTQHYKKEYYGV